MHHPAHVQPQHLTYLSTSSMFAFGLLRIVLVFASDCLSDELLRELREDDELLSLLLPLLLLLPVLLLLLLLLPLPLLPFYVPLCRYPASLDFCRAPFSRYPPPRSFPSLLPAPPAPRAFASGGCGTVEGGSGGVTGTVPPGSGSGASGLSASPRV